MVTAIAPGDARIGRRLLEYLRETVGPRDLGYAVPPRRILGGYETSIYSFRLSGSANGLSGPLILRVLRQNHDAQHAHSEATTQNYVAAQGFPAPRVHLVCIDPDVLGARFLIMDQLPGTLLAAEVEHPARLLFGLPRLMRRVPRILADLQARLHALDPANFLAVLQAAGVSAYSVSLDAHMDHMAGLLDEPGLESLRPALDWLAEHRPAATGDPVICHGDFHPLNILMSGEEVSGVIDWTSVTVAEREYDVARTRFPLLLGPVDVPRVLAPFAEGLRHRLAARYLRRYAAHHPVDTERVRYYEVLIGLSEVAFGLPWHPARSPQDHPSPYGDPLLARTVLAYLSGITDLPLVLPNPP